MVSLKLQDEDFSDGLYHIAQVADYLLGGGHDPGCGVDYKNDTFTMYGFWAHSECNCTKAEEEMNDWYGSVKDHLPDCYYVAVNEIPMRDHDAAVALAREWNLPQVGCRIHCTCGFREARMEWDANRPHDEDCADREWFFEHPGAGLKVKWYKRIGRSTESNESLTMTQWYTIVLECLNSLKEDQKNG